VIIHEVQVGSIVGDALMSIADIKSMVISLYIKNFKTFYTPEKILNTRIEKYPAGYGMSGGDESDSIKSARPVRFITSIIRHIKEMGARHLKEILKQIDAFETDSIVINHRHKHAGIVWCLEEPKKELTFQGEFCCLDDLYLELTRTDAGECSIMFKPRGMFNDPIEIEAKKATKAVYIDVKVLPDDEEKYSFDFNVIASALFQNISILPKGFSASTLANHFHSEDVPKNFEMPYSFVYGNRKISISLIGVYAEWAEGDMCFDRSERKVEGSILKGYGWYEKKYRENAYPTIRIQIGDAKDRPLSNDLNIQMIQVEAEKIAKSIKQVS
jgi:hypothetical protein